MTSTGRSAGLVVAAALLALAIVVFVTAPNADVRARTSFAVPAPLPAADVIRQIRSLDVKAEPAGADAVDASATASSRAAAQQRLVSAVDRSADYLAGVLAAAALTRANDARAAGTKAEQDAAALAAATGLTDPDRAYQQRRAELAALRRDRARRAAAGKSTAAADSRIASAQEDVFDLQFLAQHHEELTQQQDRAVREVTAATEMTEGARRAAQSVKDGLRVSAARTSGWRPAAIPIAVLAAIVAAVALAARRRVHRPAPRPARVTPQPRPTPTRAQMNEADALLVEQALIRARARRAAAEAAASAPPEPAPEPEMTVIDATGDDDAEIVLAAEPDSEEPRHDAERPLGGA